MGSGARGASRGGSSPEVPRIIDGGNYCCVMHVKEANVGKLPSKETKDSPRFSPLCTISVSWEVSGKPVCVTKSTPRAEYTLRPTWNPPVEMRIPDVPLDAEVHIRLVDGSRSGRGGKKASGSPLTYGETQMTLSKLVESSEWEWVLLGRRGKGSKVRQPQVLVRCRLEPIAHGSSTPSPNGAKMGLTTSLAMRADDGAPRIGGGGVGGQGNKPRKKRGASDGASISTTSESPTAAPPSMVVVDHASSGRHDANDDRFTRTTDISGDGGGASIRRASSGPQAPSKRKRSRSSTNNAARESLKASAGLPLPRYHTTTSITSTTGRRPTSIAYHMISDGGAHASHRSSAGGSVVSLPPCGPIASSESSGGSTRPPHLPLQSPTSTLDGRAHSHSNSSDGAHGNGPLQPQQPRGSVDGGGDGVDGDGDAGDGGDGGDTSAARMKAEQEAAFRALFGLPHEPLVSEHIAGLLWRFVLIGRLYLCKNFVCFHTHLYGHVRVVEVIPFSDVHELRAENDATILVVTHNRSFRFFIRGMRDRVLDVACGLWRARIDETRSKAARRRRAVTSSPSSLMVMEASDGSDEEEDDDEEDEEEDEDEDSSGEMNAHHHHHRRRRSRGTSISSTRGSQGSPHASTSSRGAAVDASSATATRGSSNADGGVGGASSERSSSLMTSGRRSLQGVLTVPPPQLRGGGGRASGGTRVRGSSAGGGGGRGRSATPGDAPSSSPSSSSLASSTAATTSASSAASMIVFASRGYHADGFLRGISKHKILHQCEFPVSVVEFFRRYWSGMGDAAHFTEAYHRARRSKELRIGRWEATVEGGGTATRQLSFKNPINNRLGPSDCHLTEVQRYHLQPHLLVIDIRATSRGVPYSDSFVVEQQWHVREGADSPRDTCVLTLRGGVHWIKKPYIISNAIESNAIKELKESLNHFKRLAQSERYSAPQPHAASSPASASAASSIRLLHHHVEGDSGAHSSSSSTAPAVGPALMDGVDAGDFSGGTQGPPAGKAIMAQSGHRDMLMTALMVLILLVLMAIVYQLGSLSLRIQYVESNLISIAKPSEA